MLGAEAKCFFFLEILEMTGTCFGNHRHEARGSEAGLPPLTGCRVHITGTPYSMNDQQEALRRFAQQIKRASNGGGGFPGGSPRGLYAGGGLLIALVAGGIALNASLFNGGHPSRAFIFNNRLSAVWIQLTEVIVP